MGLPVKNIVKTKAPTPKNSIFVFYSTPKEILSRGGEWVRVLDAIAPCGWWGQHNMTAAHKTMFSSCMARRPTVLDKDGKLARFGFCAVSSLIWRGGGGLGVCCSILFRPRLQVQSAEEGGWSQHVVYV